MLPQGQLTKTLDMGAIVRYRLAPTWDARPISCRFRVIPLSSGP